MTNKHPWLITIDLDGTLLSDPIEGNYPNTNYNKYNSEIIKKAIQKGHKIAIVTGRPWRDTEKIYKELDLRTIVANYNGANIHHPHDEIFKPIHFGINRKFFKEIVKNKTLKKGMENFVVEGPTCTQVLNLNDNYMLEQFHIDKNSKDVLQCDLNVELKENPQSFIFKINKKKVDKNELITELRRKFGEALLFRFWKNRHKDFISIEVNAKSITKGNALQYIASYYNIPLFRTIAFGDGENDLEMLKVASLGVAMKNASDLVKSYANDISDYNNNDAGVGKYLEKFFNL